MRASAFLGTFIAATVTATVVVPVNAQLPDGNHTGRLTCGSLVREKLEVPRHVDDVVQLVVVGKFVTWSRTTREYQEAAQLTFVEGSMDVDARGAYKPEFGARRAWRMRGKITQIGNELRGKLTQDYFAGGRRDCEIVVRIEPLTTSQNSSSAKPPDDEKIAVINSIRPSADERVPVSNETFKSSADTSNPKNGGSYGKKSAGLASSLNSPEAVAKLAPPLPTAAESKDQELVQRKPDKAAPKPADAASLANGSTFTDGNKTKLPEYLACRQIVSEAKRVAFLHELALDTRRNVFIYRYTPAPDGELINSLAATMAGQFALDGPLLTTDHYSAADESGARWVCLNVPANKALIEKRDGLLSLMRRTAPEVFGVR